MAVLSDSSFFLLFFTSFISFFSFSCIIFLFSFFYFVLQTWFRIDKVVERRGKVMSGVRGGE